METYNVKDGLAYTIDKSLLEDANRVKTWWENLTGLELEREEFERFYQYAINDYIGVKKGWRESHDPKLIKKKGLFIDTPVLGKGLAPLIIPEAINKYFVEGVDPEKTIRECRDILKFCTFQKVAKDFEVFYGGKRVTHINRYYMSMYGQTIYKQKVDDQGKPYGSATALCATSNVTIYNKVDDTPIEKRDINYYYYLAEAYKIIEKLDVQQLTLW